MEQIHLSVHLEGSGNKKGHSRINNDYVKVNARQLLSQKITLYFLPLNWMEQ
jgi:hypothetical protein